MPMDPVEEIKNRLDIKDLIREYIKIEKSGINYRASCPFHKEKTPSFFVSPGRQLWRCFGCGEGGDVFTFVEKIEGVEFKDALGILAQKAGVELKKQDPKIRSERNKIIELCELASKYFQYQLESKNGSLIKEYLNNRGITQKSIEEFRIGYAPLSSKSFVAFLRSRNFNFKDMENAGLVYYAERSGEYILRFRGRIIFPIMNANGDVVAFGGRKLPDELAERIGRDTGLESAKYINSPQTLIYDKSNTIYGLDKAKMAIRQEDACTVVEGYTDVILAHQNGYRNVVAASGTALTERQLELIRRFTNNLYTCFDMDVAGDTATRRGIDIAQSMGFDVKVITLEKGLDPADIIKDNKEKWDEALKKAKSVVQFYFDSALDQFGKKTPESKRDVVKAVAKVIKNIPNKTEQGDWVQKITFSLGMSEPDDIFVDINAVKEENPTYSNEEQDRPVQKKLTKQELFLREILMYVLYKPKRIKKTLEYLPSLEKSDLLEAKILNAFKDTDSKESQHKAIQEFDTEKKNIVDQLTFEIEIKGSDIDWSKDAFKVLITNYKKAILDEELRDLQMLIQKNENNGEEGKNQELLDVFHKKTIEKQQLN